MFRHIHRSVRNLFQGRKKIFEAFQVESFVSRYFLLNLQSTSLRIFLRSFISCITSKIIALFNYSFVLLYVFHGVDTKRRVKFAVCFACQRFDSSAKPGMQSIHCANTSVDKTISACHTTESVDV